MSPKGVEHDAGQTQQARTEFVHPSMSPKGVEHNQGVGAVTFDADVHPSMSPKGVEHVAVGTRSDDALRASINVAERR